MHKHDIQYVGRIISYKNASILHNFKSNQKDNSLYPLVFKKFWERIEILFSRLRDRLMLKHNYAGTCLDSSVGTFTKITSVTLLQYLNLKNARLMI